MRFECCVARLWVDADRCRCIGSDLALASSVGRLWFDSYRCRWLDSGRALGSNVARLWVDPDLCRWLESALALVSTLAVGTALAFNVFNRSGCEFELRFAAISEDRWDRDIGKLSRMEEEVLVGRLA